MPRRMLVPELGLEDTRRNRRWLAVMRALQEELGEAQEVCERVAWRVLRTYEGTR